MLLEVIAALAVSLGAERQITEVTPAGGLARVGPAIPNDGGYLLLYNRTVYPDVYQPLRAMQLDMDGHPVRDWALPVDGVKRAGRAGARAHNGNIVTSWWDVDHDVLAVLTPDGRNVVATTAVAKATGFVSIACNRDRCLGAAIRYTGLYDFTTELSLFDNDGHQLAGPVTAGNDFWSYPVIVADGDNFKMTWSEKDGIYAGTVDAGAKLIDVAHLAPTGTIPTIVSADQPIVFYVEENWFDVKAVLPGQPPKTILHSDSPGGVFGLAAAWNGSEILLTVEEVTESGVTGFDCIDYPTHVRGLRLSGALDPIDKTPFPIVTADAANDFPTVASNGGGFLTAGVHGTFCYYGLSAFATHIAADGKVDPPGLGRPIAEVGSRGGALAALEAAGLDVVLWQDDHSPRLLAARIDRGGNRLDAAPILVTTEATSWMPAASDGVSVFVLSEDGSKGWLLNAATGAVAERKLIAGLGSVLGVVWTGSRYDVLTSDRDLFVASYTADGRPLGLTMITYAWIDSAAIAVAGGQRVVAWTTSDGTFVNGKKIAPRQQGLRLASDGKSLLLLMKDRDLRAAILSPDGTVLDTGVLDPNGSDYLSAFGRIGDHWLVSWTDYREQHIVAFRSPSSVDTVPIAFPYGADFRFLSRADGSAVAVLPSQRDGTGALGPIQGDAIVERAVEIVPLRRPASKH